jgi:hypothetical protein
MCRPEPVLANDRVSDKMKTLKPPQFCAVFPPLFVPFFVPLFIAAGVSIIESGLDISDVIPAGTYQGDFLEARFGKAKRSGPFVRCQ